MNFESFGLSGLFLSSFISSTIAPGGSEAVLAYLVTQNHYSIEILVLTATVANTLGAMTTLWLGVLTQKKYPSHSLTEKHYARSLHYLQKWGCITLLFSWLPIIGDALCFTAGWLRLSLLPAITAILIGKGLRYLVVALTFSHLI